MPRQFLFDDFYFNKNPFRIILHSTILIGTIDAIAAIVFSNIVFNIGLDMFFKYTASMVFGETAFQSGFLMVAAGIAIHYLLTNIWTLFFFLIYPDTWFLRKHKFVIGIIYGLFIWAIMNLIVMRISNSPKINYNFESLLVSMAYLAFMVGIPISILNHKLMYAGGNNYINIIAENP